jgi:hypothetical protein
VGVGPIAPHRNINLECNQNLAIISYNNISLSKYSTFEAGTTNKIT